MIQLMKSTFYNEKEIKEKLADFIVSSDFLSMGEQCEKYEETFSQIQERKYSVFVSSGSMANLVLLQALLNLGKLHKGDKVGVSALTWATNIMPVIQLGLVPVVIDCEKDTLNVSPDNLQRTIKKQPIKALFLTNVLGFSDDIHHIQGICQKENIVFLEDNCESFGSKTNGKFLGNFGYASTFSHFVGHHLSTIEGGLVCTDDKELYDMVVMVRAHGWDRNLDTDKQQELRSQYDIDDFFAQYTFYDLAYNARPTDIQGFIANEQVNFYGKIIEKREKNFLVFHDALRENSELYDLQVDHMDVISNFAMPVICKDVELFERYKKKFQKNDVEIRPMIAGDITKQPFYRKYVSDQVTYKNADFIHKQGFYFPNNPELTEEEVDLLVSLIKSN